MSTSNVPSGVSVAQSRRSRWRSLSTSGVAIAALALGVLTPLTVDTPASAAVTSSGVPGVETVSADSLPTPQISAERASYVKDAEGYLLDSSSQRIPAIAAGTFAKKPEEVAPGGPAPVMRHTITAGVAWEQIVVGDTVFVGGNFTWARPAGADRGTVNKDGSGFRPGKGDTERSNFLAYRLSTGELREDIDLDFNGQIRALTLSPDKSRLYVGGEFTSVDGTKRNRLAALDLSGGALPTVTLSQTFMSGTDRFVRAIAATNETVYVGGHFKYAYPHGEQGDGTVEVHKTVAFAATDGAIRQDWKPKVGDPSKRDENGKPMSEEVFAMVINPAGDKIVLGGSFRWLNGRDVTRSMAAVDTVTGSTRPWKINQTVPDRTSANAAPLSTDLAVYSLSSDRSSVYGTMGPGNFEGTFKAAWTDGAVQWLQDCHGDSYDVATAGDVVYVAGHAHDCANIGGFTDYSQPKGWYRTLALTNTATQKVRKWDGRYGNFEGNPAPTVLNWYPDFNTGAVTGQGPWDMETAGGFVLVGGEFSTINGSGQDGLARFAPKSTAPNDVGPHLAGDWMKPSVVTWSKGVARLTWGTNFDWDDAALRYEVIRDGDLENPVFSTSLQSSPFWEWRKNNGEKTGGRLNKPGDPIRSFVGFDSGLTDGRSYSYQIRTVDPDGNSTLSDPVTFTPAAGAAAAVTEYDKIVMSDQPSNYWNLNEPANAKFGWDLAAQNTLLAAPKDAKTHRGIETKDIGGTSQWVDAARTAPIVTQRKELVTDEYTSELWFRAGAGQKGVLLSLQSTQSPSGNADRQIYINDSGRLWTTNWDGSARSIGQNVNVADGAWHQVAVSVGRGSGVSLYLDGKKVAAYPGFTMGASRFPEAKKASGHWMIGTGMVSGLTNLTGSGKFQGYIDNVAVYPRVLDAAVIKKHAASRGVVTVAAPTASFTASASELALTVDGSASLDPAGGPLSYAWDFGDGATATTAKAQHTYAGGKTYTVKLTVTSASGKTSTVVKEIQVARAGVIAEDSFERTGSGWGNAATGGAWATSGSGFSTNGGGVIDVTSGGTKAAILPVDAESTVSTVSFSVAEKTAKSQYVSLIGRGTEKAGYSARAVLGADGTLHVQLFGAAQLLDASSKPIVAKAGTYSPGEKLTLELTVGKSVDGATALSATVTSSTGSATVSGSDANPELQTSTGAGVKVYAAAGMPCVVTFDDYVVRAG